MSNDELFHQSVTSTRSTIDPSSAAQVYGRDHIALCAANLTYERLSNAPVILTEVFLLIVPERLHKRTFCKYQPYEGVKRVNRLTSVYLTAWSVEAREADPAISGDGLIPIEEGTFLSDRHTPRSPKTGKFHGISTNKRGAWSLGVGGGSSCASGNAWRPTIVLSQAFASGARLGFQKFHGQRLVDDRCYALVAGIDTLRSLRLGGIRFLAASCGCLMQCDWFLLPQCSQ